RPAPEFEAWLQGVGLLDEGGRIPSIAPHDSHLAGLGRSVLRELGA
ncbi:MAG: hypothetical protein H7233_14600, partial [Pseudorhodobacter sp.]|nr:hypothetical protein [Frankiaceae bacterium]